MTGYKSPHLNPEWLRKKYIDEGLSTYEIAKIVNRDPKRIYEKLKDFKIPTRPRGLNLKGTDNYMSTPDIVSPFKGRKHSTKTRKLLSKKASVPKPYLRGKRNGMSGRTGELNPNFKDGSSPERQRLYASGEWKEIIKQVFKRDNYHCVRCGSSHTTRRMLHAHHLKPWAGNQDERFNPINLITLCRLCHEWVHSSDNVNRDYLK